jgi:hypothetical protein
MQKTIFPGKEARTRMVSNDYGGTISRTRAVQGCARIARVFLFTARARNKYKGIFLLRACNRCRSDPCDPCTASIGAAKRILNPCSTLAQRGVLMAEDAFERFHRLRGTAPAPAHDAIVTVPQPVACAHHAHFEPTPAEGPTRQCRHCPYVVQVPCHCGTANWKPEAHWGADGVGVVVWTCRGCGALWRRPGAAPRTDCRCRGARYARTGLALSLLQRYAVLAIGRQRAAVCNVPSASRCGTGGSS